MAVDNVSNQLPNLTQLNSINQTGDVALTLQDLSGMSELMAITMITVSVSKVINDACSGPYGQIINTNQRQQYMDQAWESAINAAVSAAGSDADGSTSVTLPTSVTLADGSTSYLEEYLAERPNFQSYFAMDPAVSGAIDVNQFKTAVNLFSQSSIGAQDYNSNIDRITWQLENMGDPSLMPQPAPPPIQDGQYSGNAPLPQEYVDYANKLAALFNSEGFFSNPKFLYQGTFSITIDNSKNLVADINASATNYMTALQQLTNTLNNLISAMATFCAAMAKCQQAVLKAPGS